MSAWGGRDDERTIVALKRTSQSICAFIQKKTYNSVSQQNETREYGHDQEMRRWQGQGFVAQANGSDFVQVLKDAPTAPNGNALPAKFSRILVHEKVFPLFQNFQHAGVRVRIHNGQQLGSPAPLGEYTDLVGAALSRLDRQDRITPKDVQQIPCYEGQQGRFLGDFVLNLSLASIEDGECQ